MVALVERQGSGQMLPRTRFSAMVVAGSSPRRSALAHRLRSLGAREVVEAGSTGEARARAHQDGPRDLCIVDGTMPDGPPLALLQELRSAGWRRVLLLSSRDDPYSVRAAMANGVRGYVVLPEQVAGQPNTPRPRTRTRTPDELSAREVEVIQLVAEGRSNREIGDQLGLSALTVKSHLARIARKLGTGDRAEMVALSMRAGLVR